MSTRRRPSSRGGDSDFPQPIRTRRSEKAATGTSDRVGASFVGCKD